MGFVENLMASTGGFLGAKAPAQRGFKKILKASDFQTSAVTVITTDFTKIGEYTVPAQQEVSVGYGNANQPDNQGYLYVVSKNTATTAMEGTLRISVANATETKIDVVFEDRTDRLSGSATLRTQQVALPEVTVYEVMGRRPREDDRIQLRLKVDTAGSWSPTQSTVYIPVTVYQ